MGDVYLAEDMRLRRRVALKVLSPNYTNDDNRLRRFEQEARAASALNHPNILTIYEIGQYKQTHFIATEFIEGETLRQHLTRARMGIKDLLDVTIQVASALAAAHKAGIVHRDIKPDNIMLRPDGYAKVLDFGIAKLTEEQSGERRADPLDEPALINTDSNIVLGSPSYMSPEQARGLKIDARSDIFSFGVVLYEMIAGRKPFEGATPSDVIASILHNDTPWLPLETGHIPEGLKLIVKKALIKDKEARYQTAAELANDLRSLRQRIETGAEVSETSKDGLQKEPRVTQATNVTSRERSFHSAEITRALTATGPKALLGVIKRHKNFAALLVLLAVMVSAAFWYFTRRSEVLNERDSILLADFANTTNDPVFDGTLRQALAVQLGQSPFLDVFSDERSRETLRYMNRSPDERLTVPVAREICQRHGLKCLLTGSISPLGSHYVISIEAVNAYTGDVIAREQVQAEGKEHVLKALGGATSKLREKLGESLPTIQKFDAPIEQATTSSLEALKAYSLGNEQQNRARYIEAIPFYKRAIELDPNFALAHARLAVAYDNSRQPEPAAEHAARAYELRDRVSERERFFILWRYNSSATRDWDKTIEALELWKQTYPRDIEPHNTLAFYYNQIGQFDKAIQEAEEAIRLNPNKAQPYSNLGQALTCLGRFDESKAVYERAVANNIDSTSYRWGLYLIAFAQGNRELMDQQIGWMSGKPNEHEALDWQAKTHTFLGQFNSARAFSDRATELAEQRGLKELAAQFAARAKLRAAVTGACDQNRAQVPAADASENIPPGTELSLALALCGATSQPLASVAEQARRFPNDTPLNRLWLPLIRAVIHINRNSPGEAIEALQQTSQYEMGYAAGFWPAYLRGRAYLQLGRGSEAAAEFEKVIGNRGININSNLYPLAHLGLARAAALSGDVARSRKAYEEFLLLWKDADPDNPTLRKAQEEYKRLK